MAKFKWQGVGMGLDGGQKEYILSAATKNSSKWYATIRWYSDSDTQWCVVMRDWDTWAPLDFTDLSKPPKEYVEDLVRLAFNIGENDG